MTKARNAMENVSIGQSDESAYKREESLREAHKADEMDRLTEEHVIR